MVQQQPRGLCDALFRAEPFVRDDQAVLIGLPDTIWFPENAYAPALNQDADVNLVLFPVLNPAVFDAVVCDEQGYVERVEVKRPDAHSHWIWGAVTARGSAFRALKRLWDARHREDEFLGHLLNAYIAAGNLVRATYLGRALHGCGNPRRLSRGAGLPARPEVTRPYFGSLTRNSHAAAKDGSLARVRKLRAFFMY